MSSVYWAVLSHRASSTFDLSWLIIPVDARASHPLQSQLYRHTALYLSFSFCSFEMNIGFEPRLSKKRLTWASICKRAYSFTQNKCTWKHTATKTEGKRWYRFIGECWRMKRRDGAVREHARALSFFALTRHFTGEGTAPTKDKNLRQLIIWGHVRKEVRIVRLTNIRCDQ